METADTLLKAIAHLTGENVQELEKAHQQPVANPEVQKHLQSKNVLASGISVLAEVDYTSLSGNAQHRDVVIRRVMKSGKDIFIDAFCLGIKAPRLIKMASIQKIKDKKSGQEFTNPAEFFENILGVDMAEKPQKGFDLNSIQTPLQASNSSRGELKTAIARTRNEITALMFISGVDGSRDHVEFEQIAQYVHRRCPDLVFKDEDLYQYLNMLYPDQESFYQSMERILGNEGWVVKLFLEHMIHLISSDGKIDEKERIFLAEVMTILKNEGFVIKF